MRVGDPARDGGVPAACAHVYGVTDTERKGDRHGKEGPPGAGGRGARRMRCHVQRMLERDVRGRSRRRARRMRTPSSRSRSPTRCCGSSTSTRSPPPRRTAGSSWSPRARSPSWGPDARRTVRRALRARLGSRPSRGALCTSPHGSRRPVRAPRAGMTALNFDNRIPAMMAPGLRVLRNPSPRHRAFVPPPALTGGRPVRVAPPRPCGLRCAFRAAG